jgi:hypothetical protein
VNDRWVYAALPFITVIALGAGFLVLFRQRAAARRSLPPIPTLPRRPDARFARPWWGNPWLWVGVCAVSIVLGLLVWPGLFGGVFLVLPFVWVVRPRREPPMDPRSNGHTTRDAGAFTGD